MIVILGAGLAGLSTALHLKHRPFKVCEAEREVGGLCRSVKVDGFTFDYTGHLLYLHHEPVKTFLHDLIQGKMRGLKRSAWIYASGVHVPFPFQVNTHGLPAETRVECLLGFVQARMKDRGKPGRAQPVEAPGRLDFLEQKQPPEGRCRTLEEWIDEPFGPGFAKHFFRPYNEKLWCRPLSEMTSDWVSWSVPVPDLDDVLRGALGLKSRRFGYNADILYPLEGGIRILPEAMAAALGPGAPLHLGKRAVSIEASAKKVRFEDGEEETFEWLVSTMPLNRLVSLIEDAPVEVRLAAAALASVGVFGVDLGVEGGFGPGSRWTSFPDASYLFYRTGYISHYAKAAAPEGFCSLTAEVARRPDAPPPGDLEGRVVNDLVRAGVIESAGQVVLKKTVRIDPAYVVFDRARKKALPLLFDYLMRRRIMPIGRYGAWNYLGMEDSILHGMQAAARIESEENGCGEGG